MSLDTALSLTKLLDPVTLARSISDGYVRVQYHPTAPLAIYNYTEKAQYDRVWNTVTTTCRGLIANGLTGEVVARPYRKFWEYRPGDGSIDLTAPAEVTDKADGSLGIIYHDGTGWAVATRGSFAGYQARHATGVLRARYPGFEPPAGMTVLVEIVYPGNRIVVDYGGLDDLVLLGAVDIATGRVFGPDDVPGWIGPVTDVMPARTLAEALTLPSRPDQEGLVVRTEDGRMVKIKEEQYLHLHRILTETSARVIWEYLAVGACRDLISAPRDWSNKLHMNPARVPRIIETGDGWRDRLLEGVPAEFHGWFTSTADGMVADVERLRGEITATAAELLTRYPDRKQLATALSVIQAAANGEDITTGLWKLVYPPHDLPFAQTEDSA
jgi:RNA ligase